MNIHKILYSALVTADFQQFFTPAQKTTLNLVLPVHQCNCPNVHTPIIERYLQTVRIRNTGNIKFGCSRLRHSSTLFLHSWDSASHICDVAFTF